MRLRAVIDAAATALVGAADRVDEAAAALEAGRGRVTVVGRTLKLAALSLGLVAVPVVVLDILTGGPAARDREDDQRLLANPDLLASIEQMLRGEGSERNPRD